MVVGRGHLTNSQEVEVEPEVEEVETQDSSLPYFCVGYARYAPAHGAPESGGQEVGLEALALGAVLA